MKKIDLSAILAKFKLSLETDPSKIEPNPKRDWTILFIVFCVIFVISGIAHQIAYRYFLKISNQEPVIVADSTKVISREDIEKIINTFNVRDAEFQKILREKPVYPDPSK